MRKLTVFFICFLFCFTASALELHKKNNQVHIKIEEIDLPKKILNKKFKSGLKTEIIYSIELESGRQSFNLEKGYISVQYDLWDEVYTFNKNSKKVKKLKSLAEIYSSLENISLVLTEAFVKSLKTDFVKIRPVFLLNPIGKEKSKKIKKWIAERNVGRSPGGLQLSNSNIGNSSILTGIVNRVVIGELDKEIYGADKKFVFESPAVDLKKVKKWKEK